MSTISQQDKMTQGGFTLLEVLVYIGVISLIAITFMTFSLSILDSKSKTDVIQEVHANQRIVLATVSRKIRSATGINVASSTFSVDPGVLVINTSSSSTDPTIIDLDQDDGRLRITEGTSTPLFITSSKVKVTNLVFTNLTASSTRENIRMEATFQYDGPSDDPVLQYSRSFRTSVTVRR